MSGANSASPSPSDILNLQKASILEDLRDVIGGVVDNAGLGAGHERPQSGLGSIAPGWGSGLAGDAAASAAGGSSVTGGEASAGRPDNIRDSQKTDPPPASPSDVAWPLKELETSPCECAEGTGRQDGQPCSSAPVIDTIIEFVREVAAHQSVPAVSKAAEEKAAAVAEAVTDGALPDGQTTGAKAVRVAAAVLGCPSESCLITHPNFAAFARKKGVAKRIELDKETRFKAAGPRSSNALLNNFNIDETLRRWARVFADFFPFNFAMSDFEQTHEDLDIIDPANIIEGRVDLDLGPGAGVVRRPTSCIACVLNTDTSRGRGKHWVATFVDARPRNSEPWTVEYFNSAGRPPFASAARWMEKTRESLTRLRASESKKYGSGPVTSVPVTEVDHQLGDIECGVFALLYIRSRLEGKPISFWQGDRISDEIVHEFRKHLFRASK